MKYLLALLLLVWNPAGGLTVVGPEYPPDAFEGGTVVAALHLSRGAVSRVEILSGAAPFVGSVQSALARWHFDDSGQKEALVVVSFRTPNLYPTGSPDFRPGEKRPAGALPFPRLVVEPSYPPDSLGEGAVVLQLEVDASGSVSKTKVVKSLGDLTGPSEAAAKQWKFIPARDSSGAGTSSEAFAVCVFRRPLLPSNNPPK